LCVFYVSLLILSFLVFRFMRRAVIDKGKRPEKGIATLYDI
jgi:hypothetical protein